jgi:hypothetical protein
MPKLSGNVKRMYCSKKARHNFGHINEQHEDQRADTNFSKASSTSIQFTNQELHEEKEDCGSGEQETGLHQVRSFTDKGIQ